MTRSDELDGWSPQGPVIELSGAQCWRLIDGPGVGRIGLSVDNQPEIFPVNFFADGSDIYFRTAEGTKLHDMLVNSSVVFEVDAQLENGAWSVTVKGRAHIVRDEFDVPRDIRESLPLWIPVEEYVFARIAPLDIRGRRFESELRLDRIDADGHIRRASDPDSRV